MQLAEAREFVTWMYRGFLDREPDADGFEHYTRELTSGRLSMPGLASALASSEECCARFGTTSERGHLAGCTTIEAMAVFEQFTRFAGPGRPGYITNFLGGLTAVRYVNRPQFDGFVEGYPIPGNFHAEALEWLGTLRAVLDARGTFTMLELGAGWAPWCTVGTIAAQQKGLVPQVTAVEGDLGHIEFIRSSFAENGQPPASYRILHGIVGAKDGQASFARVRDAAGDYGGAAQFGGGREAPAGAGADGDRQVDVLPCYSLKTLLKEARAVDLVHCDVQGAEYDIFAASMGVVSSKVRRVLIGTHSLALDRKLIKLFSENGWTCEGIDSARMAEDAKGARLFCDGTQLWKNDRRV